MTPIEIIALVLIALGTLKIILLPSIWLKVVKTLYSKPKILFTVELILIGVVLYYLLQELNIVQILAAVALGALLTGLSFAIYSKETLSWAEKLLKKDIWKRAWLPILIWLALMIWGLLALFKVI